MTEVKTRPRADLRSRANRRISIVIPCKNMERWISSAILSALNQTLPPAEIIVVDDGSRDASVARARAFPEVTVVQPPDENGFGGAAPARTVGLERANEDAILFLDADDLLGPDALEGLAEVLPKGGIARCEWRRYVFEGEAWRAGPPERYPRVPSDDDLAAWLEGWFCPPAAVLWTREAIERAGGWADRQLYNDDGDLVMRALAEGVPMVPARRGLSYYRRLPDNSNSLSSRRLSERGLLDGLDVLDGISARLEARGRTSRYRVHLAKAYSRIQTEGRSFSGVVERARAARASLGVSDRTLVAANAVRRVSAAIATRARLPARPRVVRRHGPPAFAEVSVPLVSAVIPTFNRPEETVRAVKSVIAQSYRNLEIIVVDDASTDATAAMVAKLGDPRLRLHRQRTNRGVAAARNVGIELSNGSYVAFLDSDDVWFPQKIARQLEVFSQDGEGLGMVYTGSETRTLRGMTQRTADLRGDVFHALLRSNPVHSGSSLMVRKSVFEIVGGFDVTLPANEDWDFLQRLGRFFRIDAAPEPLVRVNDIVTDGRRSHDALNDIEARAIIARRTAEDIRELRLVQPCLMEFSRARLNDPRGGAWRARLDILKALAANPINPRVYPWIPYMMMPHALRAWLRQIDGRSTPRRI
jgi:O-antigen biosynthesis protein